MSDQLISNVLLALSKLPETSLNSMFVLAADFDGAVTTALNITKPNIEKIPNTGLIGLVNEFATQHDNDYITHPGITLQDRVNVNQFATLAARFLSGGIVDAVAHASDAYDHTISMLAASADPQLKSSTVAAKLGGDDLILAGMVANTLQVQMQNGAAPTYQVALVGSGKFDFMGTQTIPLVLPMPTAQKYVKGGFGVGVTMTIGSALDLGNLGRVKGFNFQASNAVITNDRRAGDPERVSGNIDGGFYSRNMTHGGARTASLTVDLYKDANKVELNAHLNNTRVSDISLKFTGAQISTIYYNEVEIIIPQAIIGVNQVRDDAGKLVDQLDFQLENKSGETGPFKIRVRNGAATLDS